MKLNEITQQEDPGTYVVVKFDEQTIGKLIQYARDNNIENILDSSKLHVTEIYSSSPLNGFRAAGTFSVPLKATVDRPEIWPSRSDEDGSTSNCLVLILHCPELVKRQAEITERFGAVSDYDEFKPHVTLSYDVDNLSVDSLSSTDSIGELTIVSEYTEPLNKGWAKDNG